MTHKADILIVTVTEVESRAVMQAFNQANNFEATPLMPIFKTYNDLGEIGNARVFMTTSGMGSNGTGGSLLTVYEAINELSPTAVIMVGIAFGVDKQEQSIGDVLVAKQLYPYDLKKEYSDKTVSRDDKPSSSWWLIDLCENARLHQWRNNNAKLIFGTVLTGQTLVDNIEYRDQLCSRAPEAIGGEMEGAGLYVACQRKKVDWILVKGICDWADGNKGEDKESRQETAAQNAANFVLHALNFVEIDWKKKRWEKYQPSVLKPDFLGREDAIRDIQDCVDRGSKIIVIQAEGGVGKTTLAEQYFEQVKRYDKLLKFSMAKENKYIVSAERIVRKWLKDDLQESPTVEFEDNLDLLAKNIKDKKIGILIDNLEPSLNQDGQFINDQDCDVRSYYIRLLEVLANSSVESLTLITSRQTLNENIDKMENYHLEGLSIKTWKKFFKNLGIKINPNSTALNKINKAWAGNAKAMKILGYQIKNLYQQDLDLYWQANQEDLLEKKDLKYLVVSQFERVKGLNLDAYQLICNLGYCRYQDVPTLPEKFLFSLLGNISESEKTKIINYLRDCSLVEFVDKKYFLHPVTRAAAREQSQLSKEWKKETNQKIAEIYSEDAGSFTNLNQISAAFEAIYHYRKAEEFDECYRILMCILDAEKNLENLRCSENLWLYTSELIEECRKISDSLTGIKKAITLIPLGVLYPEVGKNKEAIKISEDILKITKELIESEPDNQKIIFAQISAHLISGRANRLIGNFTEALNSCKNAIKASKNNHTTIDESILDLDYCKALAVYEKGTVLLERAKLKESSVDAFVAVCNILWAGFSAVKQKIPQKILEFMRNPENTVPKELDDTFDYYDGSKPDTSRDNDYTKKFRITHNIGKCLRLMNLTSPSQKILNKALEILPETDNLNKTWSYVELALCSSTDDEAEGYYLKALEKIDSLEYLCKTYVLFEYGNFKYSQGYYLKAIDEYLKLEKLLEKTEFESLRARNYYSICHTYSNLSIDEKRIVEGNIIIDPRKTAGGNIYSRLKKSEDICKELNLPFINKIGELRKILQP